MESDIDFIINSFKEKKINIVLLSHNKTYDKYIFEKETDDKNVNTLNYVEFKLKNETKNYQNYDLSKDEIDILFNIIKEDLLECKNNPTLIICSEYFFSRAPLLPNQRNHIISKINDIINENKYFLFLVNFLHKLDDSLNEKEVSDLKEYLNPIDVNSNIFYYNPNPNHIDLLSNNSDIWFTNESYFIFNKKIIFTVKKQSFHSEMLLDKEQNFSLGFGAKITKLKESDSEYKLFKYFDSIMDIEICLDIQNSFNYHRKEFMSKDIGGFNYEMKNNIKEKRKIFEKLNIQDFSTKDFYIIQSDSTNLNDILHMIPNGKFVIQADPYASGIFKMNYSEAFKNKLNEFANYKEIFISSIFSRTKEICSNKLIDKSRQIIEKERVLKDFDNYYENDIISLFKKNFYNIIEKISPIKTKCFTVKEKKLIILIYNFNNN